MPSAQIQQIQDAELRALMERAEAKLDEGDNTGCVHACAEAYLRLIETNPSVLAGLRTTLRSALEATRAITRWAGADDA